MTPRTRAAARIAVAALLLAALLWWTDPRALWQLLSGADPAWLVLGLLSAVAANVASALRWWALARWLGARVGAGWALAMYFRGVAINAVLPGAVVGGDVYRAHALARQGLPMLESGLSVLFDRVGGLWVLLVVGALAAAFGLAGEGAAAALGRLGAGAVVAIGPWAFVALAAFGLLGPLAVLVAWRRGAAPAGGDMAPVRCPERLVRLAHRPGALAQYGWQVLGSAAVQGLSVTTLACAGAAIGLALPYWAWAMAAVPVFLFAALPVSFGGWGTREAAAVVSLAAFGVGAPQAVAVAMLYGVAALVQAIGGIGALLGPDETRA